MKPADIPDSKALCASTGMMENKSALMTTLGASDVDTRRERSCGQPNEKFEVESPFKVACRLKRGEVTYCMIRVKLTGRR